jgi:hypothetical protein
MQHVNYVADRGQLDDPVSAGRLTYPDLANADADRWHGSPVSGIFADLNLKQLVSSFTTCVVRKSFEIGSAAAMPSHFLHSPDYATFGIIDQCGPQRGLETG